MSQTPELEAYTEEQARARAALEHGTEGWVQRRIAGLKRWMKRPDFRKAIHRGPIHRGPGWSDAFIAWGRSERADDRALVDAGYMPLAEYVAKWEGFDVVETGGHSPPVLAARSNE